MLTVRFDFPYQPLPGVSQMYRICIWLLIIVRRYCQHQCGDSWHNLWCDLIGDAGCQKPKRSPTTAVQTAVPLCTLHPVEPPLEDAFEAATIRGIADNIRASIPEALSGIRAIEHLPGYYTVVVGYRRVLALRALTIPERVRVLAPWGGNVPILLEV
jgi:hypothetical protein